METDLATSNLARDTATAALDDKISAISSLEEQLANAITQSNTLQSELSTLTTTHAQTLASHKEELASMTASHSTALAQRDARITELSAEVERVEALLREAQETVQKLRAENDQLAQANDTLKEENARGRRTAEEIVSGMRAELERVVRMSEGFLGALGAGTAAGKDREELTSNEGETTMSGAGGKAGRLIGTVGGSDRGRKRRKFDSGLGFLDEEEVGEAD
jgi:chromosome segregation ATPase